MESRRVANFLDDFHGGLDFTWPFGGNSEAWFNINLLTEVKSPVSPIPAPPAIWLFGIGMIGLGFARRKRQPGIPFTN